MTVTITVLKWPPHSPDLKPTEHLLDVAEWEIHIMDVQLTDLQQLHDVIMSIWTKIPEDFMKRLHRTAVQFSTMPLAGHPA